MSCSNLYAKRTKNGGRRLPDIKHECYGKLSVKSFLKIPFIICRLVSLYEHVCTHLCSFTASITTEHFHIVVSISRIVAVLHWGFSWGNLPFMTCFRKSQNVCYGAPLWRILHHFLSLVKFHHSRNQPNVVLFRWCFISF